MPLTPSSRKKYTYEIAMIKKSPTGMIIYFLAIPSRKIGTGNVRNLKL